MTIEEILRLESLLEKRGYTKSSSKSLRLTNEDHYWYKGFERNNNPYEEGRAQYQVFFAIWDFEKYQRDAGWSFQVYVEVSRTISELVKIVLTSIDSNSTIEEVEQMAERFFKFVDENFSIGQEWISINNKSNP